MTKEEFIARQEEIKRIMLGYKQNIIYQPGKSAGLMTTIDPVISRLPEIKSPQETLTLEEVLAGSKEFYDKYFTLHNVRHLTQETLQANQAGIPATTGAQTARNYNSLLTTINPFEIPVVLTKGHSMVGEIQKPLIVVPDQEFYDLVEVPFARIVLGDQLTRLSIATHAHETAHSQTEGIKGYAEDYFNKEVISLFIEKLAALEVDPTGELLRLSERNRFKFISELKMVILNPELAMKFNVTKEQILEAQMYLQSTLYATKLFDEYQKARKPKDKQKIIDGIQAVFDGRITVEEMLSGRGISYGQIKDTSLIRRHI